MKTQRLFDFVHFFAFTCHGLLNFWLSCKVNKQVGGYAPNFVDDVLFLLVSVRNSSAVSYELATPRFAVKSAKRTKRACSMRRRCSRELPTDWAQ